MEDAMKKIPLKPCPFCGASADKLGITKHHQRSKSILCACGAEGPDGSTDERARTRWNRRALELDELALEQKEQARYEEAKLMCDIVKGDHQERCLACDLGPCKYVGAGARSAAT
jgi:Lar family restriction alleviation protein